MSRPEDGRARLGGFQERTERALEATLPGAGEEPRRLHEAMRYSTLDGGKRLRPTLVYAVGEALGAASETLDAPACAVELLHVYSLVHDDLPAMDNAALRRGRPTCHRRYGEANAILVGDALQALAFEQLIGATTIPPRRRLRMLAELAATSGGHGLVGGQFMDLEATGRRIDRQSLEDIHLRKTGALIRSAVLLGAAAAPQAPRRALKAYARCIGLAFQIKDDILDVEGDIQMLGKPSGSDRARGLTTYSELLGTAGSARAAAELLEEAHGKLEPLGERAGFLHWLSDYIVNREH